jgi:hypothetical protein
MRGCFCVGAVVLEFAVAIWFFATAGSAVSCLTVDMMLILFLVNEFCFTAAHAFQHGSSALIDCTGLCAELQII